MADRIISIVFTGMVDLKTGHKQARVTFERYDRITNSWRVKNETQWLLGY